MKNALCRTWNMSRKLKNVENETQTLYGMEHGEKKPKNMENEKCTLYELEYGGKKVKKRNTHCRS